MELSERYMQKFEQEGFSSVYEWQDDAGTVYPEVQHSGKKSVFVTDGSITYEIQGEKKEIKANERFNIPPNTVYSAVVGPAGWIAVIAEE